jgi:hypothetical protein
LHESQKAEAPARWSGASFLRGEIQPETTQLAQILLGTTGFILRLLFEKN